MGLEVAWTMMVWRILEQEGVHPYSKEISLESEMMKKKKMMNWEFGI